LHDFLGWGSKAVDPMILQHFKEPYEYERDTLMQNSAAISSQFLLLRYYMSLLRAQVDESDGEAL
jgi:hypothetical protein